MKLHHLIAWILYPYYFYILYSVWEQVKLKVCYNISSFVCTVLTRTHIQPYFLPMGISYSHQSDSPHLQWYSCTVLFFTSVLVRYIPLLPVPWREGEKKDKWNKCILYHASNTMCCSLCLYCKSPPSSLHALGTNQHELPQNGWFFIQGINCLQRNDYKLPVLSAYYGTIACLQNFRIVYSTYIVAFFRANRLLGKLFPMRCMTR